MVLPTGLITKYIPTEKLVSLFGNNDFLDALIGATIGSISAGHPLTSYVLGGELAQTVQEAGSHRTHHRSLKIRLQAIEKLSKGNYR